MLNLFSSFDFNLYVGVFLGLFFILTLLFGNFWINSVMKEATTLMNNFLSSFFSSLKPSSMNKFILMFLWGLFILIFFCNTYGIAPFAFSLNSQISVVLSLSFSCWAVPFLFGLVSSPKYSISHFVPSGSPLGLTFFLFMVEFISGVIRPITLSVRLCANIISGHLLMTLLASLVVVVPSTFPTMIFLNMVEIFVGLIQSYIFCTMVCLYYSELN